MKIILTAPKDYIGKKYSKPLGLVPFLGLLSIASYLKSKGMNVEIYEAGVEGSRDKKAAEIICKKHPDIVGITATTAIYYNSYCIATEIKRINKNIITVLGGNHASALPEECLRNGSFDYLVNGEGEIVLEKLIHIISRKKHSETDLKKIKGLCFFDKSGNVHISKADIIPINLLPTVDWSLLPIKKYLPAASNYKKTPAISTIISRGCPFSCIFCGHHTIFSRKVRLYSLKKIEEELIQLKQMGIKDINFWDSTFTINKKWAMEVAELLRKHNFIWNCITRADCVNEHLLQKFSECGCYCIGYGVECGSDTSLKMNKKNTKLKIIKNVVKLSQKYNIEAKLYFSIGYPWETEKDIYKTINFSKIVNADISTFTIIEPYPGCDLYEEYKKIIEDKFFRNMNHFSAKYTICKNVNKNKLLKLLNLCYSNIYYNPKYLIKRIKTIKTFEDIKKYFNAFITLIGLKK